MLIQARQYLGYHAQAAMAALNTLCKQPLATMMTVLVISITLVLPALFWVLTDNIKQLTAPWQQGGYISLYLKPALSSVNQQDVLVHVRQMPGVAKATFKTAAQGLAELEQQEGMTDILRYLPDNPLPAMIEVAPAASIHTPEALEQLYHQLKALPQVEQAKLDMQWVQRLHAILQLSTELGNGLMLLLGLAVIFIIGNTLRLGIQSRHEEILVLKLIGAKNAYIIRPFIYLGILYGFVGAILSVFLVNIFLLSLSMVANDVGRVYQIHYVITGLSVYQMVLLVFSATLLGWFAAHLSVKGQLIAIEP